jgi:cytochrome P450
VFFGGRFTEEIGADERVTASVGPANRIGSGIHYCLAAPPAWLEADGALAAQFDQYDTIWIADDPVSLGE